jgi:hypothetical protein
VTGTNDLPVAQAATASATEDGAVISGNVVATDADSNATLTYSLNNSVAGLTLGSTGAYTFDPASYDSLCNAARDLVLICDSFGTEPIQ